MLTITFSRVIRVSTGSDVSSAPSIEQSAMIPERGRDRGLGHDLGGRGHEFVGDGCGSYGGRQSVSEKGSKQCRPCGRSNHISEKCWKKFDRPDQAQLSDFGPPAPCGTP